MGEAVQLMNSLMAQIPAETYTTARSLVMRVTKSIIDHPQDEKKRSIKLDKFKEKVKGSEDFVTVMLKLGFEERGGSLVFPSNGSIPKLKDFQAAMEGGYPGTMSGVGTGLSTWSGAGSQYGGMGTMGTTGVGSQYGGMGTTGTTGVGSPYGGMGTMGTTGAGSPYGGMGTMGTTGVGSHYSGMGTMGTTGSGTYGPPTTSAFGPPSAGAYAPPTTGAFAAPPTHSVPPTTSPYVPSTTGPFAAPPSTGTYTTSGTSGAGQYTGGGTYSSGMSAFGDSMNSFGGGLSSFGGGMSSFSGGLSSYDGFSSFGGMSTYGGFGSGFGSGRGPTPLRGGMGDLGKYSGMSLGITSSKSPPPNTNSTTQSTASGSDASPSEGVSKPLASPQSSGSIPRFESTESNQTPAGAPAPPVMTQTVRPETQPQMGQQTQADGEAGKDSYNSADPLTVASHLAAHLFTSWVQVSSSLAGGEQAELSETIASSHMIVEKAGKRLGIMDDGSEVKGAWNAVKESMQAVAKGSAPASLDDVWASVNSCFKMMVAAMRDKCPPECVNIAIFLFSSVAVMSTVSSGQGVNGDLLQQFVEIAVDLPDRFDKTYTDSVANANELVIKAMTDGALTGKDVEQLTDRLHWQVNDFLAHFKSYTEPPPGSALPRLLAPSAGTSAAPLSTDTPGITSSAATEMPTSGGRPLGSGPPTTEFHPSVEPTGVSTPQPVSSVPAAPTQDLPPSTVPIPSILSRPAPTLTEVLAGIRESIARRANATTDSGSTTNTTTPSEGRMTSGGFTDSGGMLKMDSFGGTGLREDGMRFGGFSSGYGSIGATGPTIEKADVESTKEVDDKDLETEKPRKSFLDRVKKTTAGGTDTESKVTTDSASSKEATASHRVRVTIQDESDEETTKQQTVIRRPITLPEEGKEMTAEEYTAFIDSLPLDEAANLIIKVSNDLEKLWKEDMDDVTELLETREGVAANIQQRLQSRKVKLEEDLDIISENKQQAQEFLEFRAGRIEKWPVRPLKNLPDEEEQPDGAIPLQKVDPDVLHDILQRVANPVGRATATSDRAKELLQSWYILLPEFSDEAIISLAKDLEIETEGRSRPVLLELITEVWSLQGFHKPPASSSYTHEEQLNPPSHTTSEEIATSSVASAEQPVERESTEEIGEKGSAEELEEKGSTEVTRETESTEVTRETESTEVTRETESTEVTRETESTEVTRETESTEEVREKEDTEEIGEKERRSEADEKETDESEKY